MEKIEKNKIIRFQQSIESVVHGTWGVFERVLHYPGSPGELAPVICEKLFHKKTGDHFILLCNDSEHWDAIADLNNCKFKIPRLNFKGAPQLKLGMVFESKLQNRSIKGVVAEILDNYVVIDCNIPRVGSQELIIHVTIQEVRDPTADEIENGFQSQCKFV